MEKILLLNFVEKLESYKERIFRRENNVEAHKKHLKRKKSLKSISYYIITYKHKITFQTR
jgi:hypothetical protein